MIEQPRGMLTEEWIVELLKTAAQATAGIALCEHEEGRNTEMYDEVVRDISQIVQNPALNDRIMQHAPLGGMKLEVWVDHESGAHCAREEVYPKDFFSDEHWSGIGPNATHVTPTQMIGDDIERLVTEFGEEYNVVEIKLTFHADPADQRRIVNGQLR